MARVQRAGMSGDKNGVFEPSAVSRWFSQRASRQKRASHLSCVSCPSVSRRRDRFPYLREPERCSRPRLCGYFLAIARRLRGFQRIKQLAGASRDRVDRTLERSLIAFRGFGCSAYLANELKRGIMNLLVRRWRIKIEQGLNVSAHDLLPAFLYHCH
jgi:hypothetical protein